jgi:hypothetical protein
MKPLITFLNVVFIIAILLLLALLFIPQSHARDLGQWENTDPVVSEWYRNLKQPDNPSISCCGDSDAYWCDEVHVRDKKTYCNITDDRPDEPLKRPHIDIGTEIYIPDAKLTWKDGNPTGHAIVFLYISRSMMSDGSETNKDYHVYCFVQNGGT